MIIITSEVLAGLVGIFLVFVLGSNSGLFNALNDSYTAVTTTIDSAGLFLAQAGTLFFLLSPVLLVMLVVYTFKTRSTSSVLTLLCLLCLLGFFGFCLLCVNPSLIGALYKS